MIEIQGLAVISPVTMQYYYKNESVHCTLSVRLGAFNSVYTVYESPKVSCYHEICFLHILTLVQLTQ